MNHEGEGFGQQPERGLLDNPKLRNTEAGKKVKCYYSQQQPMYYLPG